MNKDKHQEAGCDKDELPIDLFGIEPRPHAPITSERRLKELEHLFNRIKQEKEEGSLK